MRETNKTLEWEQEILKGISNRYPEAKVEIKHVVKLGETKKAIIIMEKDINVYPTIYFDDFNGLEASKACNEIQKRYEKHKLTKSIDIEWFKDFEAKMWNVTAEMLYEIAKENEHVTITDMADFHAYYFNGEKLEA